MNKEAIQILQSSEDERELGWSSNQNHSIFGNPVLKELSIGISSRLRSLYDSLSELFLSNTQKLNKLDFEAKIIQIFRELSYNPEIGDAPICNKQVKQKGFFCFQCNRSSSLNSVYCKDCFEQKSHEGHYYSVIVGLADLCDCGNQQFMKKEGFCRKHKQFLEVPIPFNKEAETYLKELQFIFYLLLRIKRQIPEQIFTFEVLWQEVFKIIKKTTSCSYFYKLKASTLLIKPLPDTYRYQNRSLIEIFFTEKWNKNSLELLKDIYRQLYPVKIARKKILYELIKLFNSPFETCESLQVFANIFVQYSQMDKTLLKLFKKDIIKPIASYQLRIQFKDAARFHNFMFSWYEWLEKAQLYPQIVEVILTKTHIRSFFNIQANQMAINDEKRTMIIFQSLYIVMILSFVKAIDKLSNGKELLKKIIRECYELCIENEKKTIFCAERTLALCLFSYFDKDLKNILNQPFSDLLDLLSPKQQVRSKKFWHKILNNLLKFHFQIHHQTIPQLSKKLFISINLCYHQFLFIFLYMIDRELRVTLNVENNSSQFEQFMINSSDACQEPIRQCHEFLTNKFMFLGQIGFSSNIKKICDEGLKVVGVIESLLQVFEGETYQIILSNQLKMPRKEKILYFYRELAHIHHQEPVKEFKQIAQSWIQNQELLEIFILNDYEEIRNKMFKTENKINDIKYTSSLSFISYFISDHDASQKDFRLKIKFNSQKQKKKWDLFLNYFLNEKNLQQILDYFVPIINILNISKLDNQRQAFFLRVSINLLLRLFLETKDLKIRKYLLKVKDEIKSDDPFKDTLAKFLQMCEESKDRLKEEAVNQEHTEQVKKLSKQKKLRVLKEVKERQQKVLAQNRGQISQNDESICIICHQSSSHQPLYFLSRVKLSNILNLALLDNREPILIFSTCGHKIHEECLMNNITNNKQFASKYACFLCQQYSNIRIPIDQQSNSIITEKFLSNLLAIMNVEHSQNPFFEPFNILDKQIIGYLITSLATSTYLYSECVPKIFKSKISPLINIILGMINAQNQIKAEDSIESTVSKSSADQIKAFYFKIIKKQNQKLESPIHSVVEHMKQHLFSSSLSEKFAIYKQKPASQLCQMAVNLFELPQDLYQLSSKARKCFNCHQIWSDLSACLYCGFIICNNCDEAKDKHKIQNHLGKIVKLKLSSGQVIFENEKGSSEADNLYKNYGDESYTVVNCKKPKQGYFTLSRRSYEKMLEDILLERISDKIGVEVKPNNNYNCNVQ